ncbi:unnamed protein product [Spirodela intermedia]|uniref:Uncharacterized protein n=1 Tax=Spirodela intermedia TaxID=51605 RepID=A0A7I8JEP3_SPIIN|nr:unnamed protein product [Spirodela intermedia]CAA6668589.1 unnamed protein product [Spirodela intermedia]
MKMGTVPFIFFCLSLLVSMSRADDAPGNRPVGQDRFEIEGMISAFKNELSQEEPSSSTCTEVSGKAKDPADDGRLSNHLASLTGMLRGILPSELEATVRHLSLLKRVNSAESYRKYTSFLNYQLKSNKTCITCHKILEEITNVLGDTDKQVTIITSLLKKCENQTIFDECKEYVFAYGPVVLNSLHKIVVTDLCYMTGICADPKNQTSQDGWVPSGYLRAPGIKAEAVCSIHDVPSYSDISSI